MYRQVNVLQLDGRRQLIKITPQTTIMEILDQVCSKIGLSPNDYNLKHHRKILDVSSSVQFCGLPQHAQLELVAAATPRTESEITLCLQLETGQRRDGRFLPSAHLWEVILKLASDLIDTYESPAIIYARREIIGKVTLSSTTLRGIGLTGGRVAMRLINKGLDELRSQASVSSPLLRPGQKSASPSTSSDDKVKVDNTPRVITQTTESTSSAIEKFPSCSDSGVAIEKIETRKQISLENPTEVDGRRKSFQQELEDNLECKRVRVSSALPANPAANFFEKAVLLGPRHAVAYNLDAIPATIPEDLPDDFYELTIKDVQCLAAVARRTVMEMENAPLLTAQQRQLDHDGLTLQKLSLHKSCIIRVRFPDRSVLQGCFKPIETIQDVCDFVKEYLDNPSLDFYLYTTPPKTILKKEERLVEANCVPSINLYLGTEQQVSEPFFRPQVRNLLSTHSAAMMAVFQQRGRGTLHLKEEPAAGYPQSQLKEREIEAIPIFLHETSYHSYS